MLGSAGRVEKLKRVSVVEIIGLRPIAGIQRQEDMRIAVAMRRCIDFAIARTTEGDDETSRFRSPDLSTQEFAVMEMDHAMRPLLGA